jgi:glycosyltransferase involved in cell wall biosynthesis
MISIITPSLNRASLISTAINSVLNQDYSGIEHIIIDGGSTDGTLDVLSKFPHLKVISEPDKGLYDAINKGILISKGDIIGLLNTDDYYEPNIFKMVIKAFEQNPNISAVLGGAAFFREDNINGRKTISVFPPYPDSRFLYEVTEGIVNPNAWFFKREIFDKFGLFDTSYTINADRDFLIRLAINELDYLCLDVLIYHYRLHEDSLTFNTHITVESHFVVEMLDLCEKYLSSTNLPATSRYRFRHWHSVITTNQTLYALSCLNPMKAGRYAIYGVRHNPLWLVVFLPGFFKGIYHTFQRGFHKLVEISK